MLQFIQANTHRHTHTHTHTRTHTHTHTYGNRTIASPTITPGQIPPSIIDPLDRLPPEYLPLRTILIRIIAPRRLCCLEIFYCLLFHLYTKITLKTSNICHNKILYKHKHAFFQNIWHFFLFRIISEIISDIVASLIVAY